MCTHTGGKPLFTHWVCGEYMVGSEAKYPAWTHQVHFGYFLITLTICPQFTHPNTHQVHVEYFQKVPSTEPAEGGFDLPTGFIQINFTFRPQLLTQIPTGYMLSIFTKYPPRYPPINGLGTVVSSSRVCLKSTHYVIKMYPVGFGEFFEGLW